MMAALALSAQAAGFNKASLKGSYSFLVNTWTAESNTQDATVGVMTFDGAGDVTAPYTSVSGGVVQTGTATGTYTVNSDGTGAINFTAGGYTPQFAIALNSTAAKVAHGMQLLRADTTTNLVDSGTALLQSTAAATYSVASVRGNFSLQLSTWLADGTLEQNGIVGIISFDGKGNIKGSYTDMHGGVLSTGTFTGTYTVNSDGSGSMSLVGAGNSQLAFALNSVTAGQAKGLQLLSTSEGDNIEVSGVALKQ